ncbi:putative FAD/NAD(P)-binding domain superfamily [Helianthus annuus]|nr:putative FAD/NAD(P)-binding domain superfamily [Helianthus annuus]
MKEATIMKEATKAPKVSFYDYIVIGGGTAGIPLATTLSTNYSVLLLKRGGSPYGNPNITQVMNFGSYFLDTSPNSPSQRFISEGVINARPQVLGVVLLLMLVFICVANQSLIRKLD